MSVQSGRKALCVDMLRGKFQTPKKRGYQRTVLNHFETFKFQTFLLALIQVPSEEPMQARLSSGDRTNRTKKGLTTNKPLRTGEI